MRTKARAAVAPDDVKHAVGAEEELTAVVDAEGLRLDHQAALRGEVRLEGVGGGAAVLRDDGDVVSDAGAVVAAEADAAEVIAVGVDGAADDGEVEARVVLQVK